MLVLLADGHQLEGFLFQLGVDPFDGIFRMFGGFRDKGNPVKACACSQSGFAVLALQRAHISIRGIGLVLFQRIAQGRHIIPSGDDYPGSAAGKFLLGGGILVHGKFLIQKPLLIQIGHVG
ncbi:hypothetical protein D3C75_820800 [compost metagenome]